MTSLNTAVKKSERQLADELGEKLLRLATWAPFQTSQGRWIALSVGSLPRAEAEIVQEGSRHSRQSEGSGTGD